MAEWRGMRSRAQVMICCIGMGVALLCGDVARGDEPERTPGPPPPRWSVGAAGVYMQSPYLGQRGRFWGFPAVTYFGPRVYVVGPALGVRLAQAGPVGFGLDARMRFSPFNEREGGRLQGMRSRRSTVEAGPRVTAFLPRGFRAEWTLSADVLDEHRGVDTGLSLARSWRRNAWTFTPALRLNYWSSGLADHYYGVRAREVTEDRPAYRPGAVWTPAADLAISRKIGDDWTVLVSAGLMRFGSAVTDSPIVERRSTVRVLGAMTYAF